MYLIYYCREANSFEALINRAKSLSGEICNSFTNDILIANDSINNIIARTILIFFEFCFSANFMSYFLFKMYKNINNRDTKTNEATIPR